MTCAPGHSCTNSRCKATSGKPDDMFVIELNPGIIKFTSVAQGLMVSSVPDLRTLCVELQRMPLHMLSGAEVSVWQQLSCSPQV